ncbi:hypothetical protein K402DRAFT_1293 [Aulographum hederae CBS 113979]|uniref:Glycine zipper 2TM domain-containing protein n=1 Tax=Aulographum hederae CBS 113979 TaxID=1176131 RepID=A0A6G1HGR3_9PEZI|nr:hypothetical protein K402DRAFT_1293 [Aulographum hederae CBS 113979]
MSNSGYYGGGHEQQPPGDYNQHQQGYPPPGGSFLHGYEQQTQYGQPQHQQYGGESPFPPQQGQYPPPSHDQYGQGQGYQSPPPPQIGYGQPPYEEQRGHSPYPPPVPYGQHPSPGPHGEPQGYPTHDQQYNGPPGGAAEGDRGLGATLLGGAAGGFAGHKMGGGTLATLGSAVVGAWGANKLEDKHEKKRRSIKSTEVTTIAVTTAAMEIHITPLLNMAVLLLLGAFMPVAMQADMVITRSTSTDLVLEGANLPPVPVVAILTRQG